MNPFYNILARLNAVTSTTPVETAKPTTTVYESVEARGSITEAVKALEAKYQTFKEAKAKPDFLDVDKDGNKKEPMKKAAKDKNNAKGAFKDMFGGNAKELTSKLKIKEGQDSEAFYGAITHPDGEGEELQYKFRVKNGKPVVVNCEDNRYRDECQADVEKYYHQVSESKADDIADKKAEKEAGDWWGDKKDADKKDKREVKGSKYGGSKQKHDDEAKDKDDKKDARHFKKTKKTEILDKDDEEDLDESFEFGSKNFKNASSLKKAPKAKLVKESASCRDDPIYRNKKAWDHYEAEMNEEELNKATQELDEISKLAGNLHQSNIPSPTNDMPVTSPTKEVEEISKLAGLPKQINVDMNKGMGAPAKPDGVKLPPAPPEQEPMLEMDDEWDDESGYDLDDPKHPTWAERQREKAELARDWARDSASELDEANNAVLIKGREVNVNSIEVDGVNDWDSPDFVDAYITYAEFTDGTPLTEFELDYLYNEHGDLVNQVAHDSLQGSGDFLDEEEVEEGNEFSGALAAAKATGAKNFEVDGKRYTVKEDINVSVNANGQEDALNLFRKLAGMPMIAVAQHEEPCDGAMEIAVDEERDPEYVNSPREQVAPVSAAIPSGNDLHRSKRQYKIAQPGDNPMAVAETKDASWGKYNSMLKGLLK